MKDKKVYLVFIANRIEEQFAVDDARDVGFVCSQSLFVFEKGILSQERDFFVFLQAPVRWLLNARRIFRRWLDLFRYTKKQSLKSFLNRIFLLYLSVPS